MRADCHMHAILDGIEWRSAIARHNPVPDEKWIHAMLKTYQSLGFTYLRDGGTAGVQAQNRGNWQASTALLTAHPLLLFARQVTTVHSSAKNTKTSKNTRFL